MDPRLKQRLLEWASVLTIAMAVLVQLPRWFPIEPEPPIATADGWQALAIPVLGHADGPAVAAHLLLPQGWTSSGGLHASPPPSASHAADCIDSPFACLQWSARSADGLHGVDVLPAQDWRVDPRLTPPTQEVATPMSVTESYLRALARQRHPRAEVIGFGEDRSLLRDVPPAAAAAGGHFEAGRLRIRYQHDGHEWQETLTTIVLVLPTDAGLPLDGVEASVHAASQATFVVFHSPAVVDLDAERIRLSLRFDPDWLAYRDWKQEIRRCTQLRTECPRTPRPTATAAKDATGGR